MVVPIGRYVLSYLVGISTCTSTADQKWVNRPESGRFIQNSVSNLLMDIWRFVGKLKTWMSGTMAFDAFLWFACLETWLGVSAANNIVKSDLLHRTCHHDRRTLTTGKARESDYDSKISNNRRRLTEWLWWQCHHRHTRLASTQQRGSGTKCPHAQILNKFKSVLNCNIKNYYLCT